MDTILLKYRQELDKRIANVLRLYKLKEIDDNQLSQGVFRILSEFMLIVAREVDELNKKKM